MSIIQVLLNITYLSKLNNFSISENVIIYIDIGKRITDNRENYGL